MKPNGKNERIKREYARFLRDARRQCDASIDAALACIARYETFTRQRDFARFKNQTASQFKDDLATQLNKRTKKALSVSTQLHTLSALKGFFIWLADQPGYRSKVRYSDASYFSLSLKQTEIARATRGIAGPTIDQVRYVIQAMPMTTDLEKRNRALIAFALVSGARDNALASLKLKHIDTGKRVVFQDGRDVRTKRSKTIETWFFPVGDDFMTIVTDWVDFLKRERHWGLNDALFPKTLMACGHDRRFAPIGLAREGWSNATPIRSIFKQAYEAVGLPYFNPHSFRNTLVRFGQEICTTPETYKAWSQNLGHDDVLTTLTSYGQVDRLRQRDIILSMNTASAPGTSSNVLEEIQRLVSASLKADAPTNHRRE